MKRDRKTPHQLEMTAVQDSIHHHSATISKRRQLLQFDLELTNESIDALQTALNNKRRHKREVEARIAGITTVLRARGAATA